MNIINHQFNFKDNYVLENDVIKLSPLKEQDIEGLKLVSEDDEVWTYFLEKGINEINNYCLTAINNKNEGKEYPFVIYDKRINKCAGMTRLYNFNSELGIIKMGHTWIGKDFWGTNLNKHAKYLLLEFIFEKLKLERVGFGVHGQNLRSVNALKSIGCKKEGVLRNFLPSLNENQRIDLLLYSILKHEWENDAKEVLKRKLN